MFFNQHYQPRRSHIQHGRLTTESGVAVSSSDRTSQSTLYFTPYRGNHISLYDGSAWRVVEFSETSLSLSGLTAGKNYDVWGFLSSGSLSLEKSSAWTDDTTRADAVALLDGVSVKNSDNPRRLLGTFRATGTTTTEDSEAKRFVSNCENRVQRHLEKDVAFTHTYSGTSFQNWNSDSTIRIEWVTCRDQTLETKWSTSMAPGSGGTAIVGVGYDSGMSPTADGPQLGSPDFLGAGVGYKRVTEAGYHYLQALEKSNTGTTDSFFAIRIFGGLDL